MSDAIVTATHLSRDYGRFRALSEVNLSLGRGRVIALLQRRRKSTQLHLLIGQLEPNCRRVSYLGILLHCRRRLSAELLTWAMKNRLAVQRSALPTVAA